MNIIEWLKVLVLGIIEGYTEWIPISSTAHIILVNDIVHLNQPEEFFNVFKVVIQLGAILAIVVLYFDRLCPFLPSKNKIEKQASWLLWFKIVVACIPAAVIGLPLDNYIDSYLSTPFVIAVMLILYGILFIVFERKNQHTVFPVKTTALISFRTAFLIGLFQCLAMIPGTSRSGATILGAMFLGCSRTVSAEFSFFLGIPTMFGASFLKLIKYGPDFTTDQILMITFGMFISFVSALYSVKCLMEFIHRHDFRIFGFYRIILGIVILVSMCFS